MGGGADGASAANDDLADALRRKFVIKIRQERKARLAGRIAEADFYLRQISFFEVALELSTGDAIEALAGLRKDGVSSLLIADTEATRMLDRTRRKAWIDLALERMAEARGEAPAPSGEWTKGEDWDGEEDDLDIFPPHLLDVHDAPPGQSFRSESMPFRPYNRPAEGYDPEQWGELGPDERARAYAEQFARAAAEEQVKWEAEILTIARGVAAGNPFP